jgi:hypothetical protein
MVQYMKSPSRVFLALAGVGILLASPLNAGATSIPPLVKNLALWYDASNSGSITLASSPLVTTWNDLSGNGETLSQATTADQPTYLSNTGINSMGSVQFNGSSDFMLSNDTNFSRLLLPTSTAFIVEDPTTTTCASSIYSGPNDAGTIWYGLLIPCGASAEYFDMGNDSSGQNRNNGAVVATGAHLWMGDGTESGPATFNEDGTTLSANATTTTVTSFSCPLDVGAWNNCTTSAAGRFTGTIGEIVIYNVALSQTNYQIVEGYLACKWGLQGNLPSGHPYKSTCPIGTPTTFSPTISGLSAWYDASNSSSITLASTPTVSAWNDLSGNGKNTAQATSADQPSFVSSGINSLSSLSFNGTTDFLHAASGFPTSSDYTVAGVAKFSGNLANVILGGYTATSVISHAFWGNTAETPSLFQGQGNCGSCAFATAASVGTSAFLAVGTVATSNGAGNMYVNGGTAVTGTAPYYPVADASIELGAYNGAANYLNGSIGETLVYSRVLSTAERQFVEGYLACKWGLQSSLPSGHAYKSTCPSGTPGFTVTSAVSPTGTQVPGTVLTYTATYTNGGGILDYNPIFTIAMPANSDFQVGSVTTSNLSNNGLSAAVTYSSNGGTSYGYTPASGAGGAPSGYDRSVTNIKVSFTGALGCGSTGSTNTGTVVFVTRIQ